MERDKTHDAPEEPRDIDQEIRINEMRHQIEEAGGVMFSGESDIPSDLEEEFLARILAFENGPFATHLEILARAGLVLPPPEEVTDDALPGLLHAMFEELARHNTFVEATDHLSDRELYDLLWRDVLREETPDLPGELEGNCHIDLVSGGGDEATEAWLMYYASDRTRAEWVRQFPEYRLPERRKAPFDRDRHLPRG